MKLRLLFTSALFLFVQIATMHAQETVDVAKITCQQVIMGRLAPPTHDVVMWLSGYYNGKRDNTIIDPDLAKKNKEKVNQYCYEHRETTVMDAVKNVLGFDK